MTQRHATPLPSHYGKPALASAALTAPQQSALAEAKSGRKMGLTQA
ncbi:MAG: hypothetical protein AAF224_06370 [Pseudomonadota bacterium]